MCRSNLTHSNLGSPIQAEFPQDPHPQIPTTHLCCRTSLQEIHQDCVWLNRSCRCLPRERGVTGVMSHYCHVKNTVGACWEFRMSVPDASLPSVGRMGGAHLWLKIFRTTYCDKKRGIDTWSIGFQNKLYINIVEWQLSLYHMTYLWHTETKQKQKQSKRHMLWVQSDPDGLEKTKSTCAHCWLVHFVFIPTCLQWAACCRIKELYFNLFFFLFFFKCYSCSWWWRMAARGLASVNTYWWRCWRVGQMWLKVRG